MKQTGLKTATNESMSWRAFFAACALAVGLALIQSKLWLLHYLASGAEGETEFWKTFGKMFLCLGWDVVGALLVAGICLVFAWPFYKLAGRKAAFAVVALLLAGHGFFLVISYNVQKGVGTPFDKAAIELAFLNSDATAEMAASGGMWDSIGPYLNLQMVIMECLWGIVPGLLVIAFYRLAPRVGRAVKCAVAALALIFTLLTVALLPNLRNGELFGARVHTFGMERSHFVSLAKSYLLPPLRALFNPQYRFDDPFCLDNPSVVSPGAMEENPLAAPENGLAPRRTNLIFVLLESVASPYLADPAVMPFLGELAGRPGSAAFSEHYATWPQTMKAGFSLFCSELPYPDYPPITHINPSIPCVSLTEALHQAGYATALYTSADLAYDRQLRFYKHRKLDEIHDMYTMPGREGGWKNNWGIDESITIRAMFDWAEKQKKEAPERPFALIYGMSTGHHPYIFPGSPPPSSTELNDERAMFLKCLTYIDSKVKEAVDAAAARGLLDDTLIVVVSDHGEGFEQHPLSRSHGPLVYEETVHVPLVLHGPQIGEKIFKVAFPTSHIDVAPTLLSFLGLPTPLTMKGRDLTKPTPVMPIIFSGRPPPSQVGIRDGKWKYLLTQETGREELFDMEADPEEKVNLIADQLDLAAKLKARLEFWQRHGRNLIENYAGILKDHGRDCKAGPAGR
ncbi:MAG: hypothetical protein C4523_00350 [Myxococcales bacterium]|nr:MAG: hypothetical protein C4523_00350 [Myxococcales bacterium]